MSSPEHELISRALGGDYDALGALLERHGPKIRAGMRGSIPLQHRSLLSDDDVMQQTYADAFLDIGRFTPLGEGAFRAWLATLAKYNLRDAVAALNAEKRGGNRKRADVVDGDKSCVALLELLSSSGTSPTLYATRGEIKSAITQAVAKLPKMYGEVVRLYDLEQNSVEHVAVALNRSVGAVYMLRARAHDRLRDLLGNADGFFTDSP